MSANLARTGDGWWVATPAGMVRLNLPAATTGGLLADRAALAAAAVACGVRGPAQPGDRSGPVMECEALRKKAGGTVAGSNPESIAWDR